MANTLTIKTRRLSDGTTQIGHYIPTNHEPAWHGVTCLLRSRGGYISDRYPGWLRTVGEWKIRVTEILSATP